MNLQLRRLKFRLYLKNEKRVEVANFYYQKDNEINNNILNALLRTAQSKYASITAHDIKLEPVINPTTNEKVKVKVWDSDAKEEVEKDLLNLRSFSTGFDTKTKEFKEQNWIITLEQMVFDGEVDGKMTSPILYVFKNKESGEVENGDLLKAAKEQIFNNKGKIDAEVEKSQKNENQYYIKSINS